MEKGRETGFICPLRMIASAVRSSESYCIEERCAWWFENCCAILGLLGTLESIYEELQ